MIPAWTPKISIGNPIQNLNTSWHRLLIWFGRLAPRRPSKALPNRYNVFLGAHGDCGISVGSKGGKYANTVVTQCALHHFQYTTQSSMSSYNGGGYAQQQSYAPAAAGGYGTGSPAQSEGVPSVE